MNNVKKQKLPPSNSKHEQPDKKLPYQLANMTRQNKDEHDQTQQPTIQERTKELWPLE